MEAGGQPFGGGAADRLGRRAGAFAPLEAPTARQEGAGAQVDVVGCQGGPKRRRGAPEPRTPSDECGARSWSSGLPASHAVALPVVVGIGEVFCPTK
jgi:hypothetical protein